MRRRPESEWGEISVKKTMEKISAEKDIRILYIFLVLFIICMYMSGCQKKDMSHIPPLENVIEMSDEEINDCLTGCTRDELIDAWGEPSPWIYGRCGDNWILGGKAVTVFYRAVIENDGSEYFVSEACIAGSMLLDVK